MSEPTGSVETLAGVLLEDDIECFKCCDCGRLIPVQYRITLEGDLQHYGGGDAVCAMCWSYWEYIGVVGLRATDAPDWGDD